MWGYATLLTSWFINFKVQLAKIYNLFFIFEIIGKKCSHAVVLCNAVLESLFNKVPDLKPANLLKRNSSASVSGKFYEIFKNTFSYVTPLTNCFYREAIS